MHQRPSGYVFWQFALCYSLLRGPLEEPFRDNPLTWTVYESAGAGIGFVTLAQLASVAIIAIALVMLLASPGRSDERQAARPGAAVDR